ncbi:MAG: TolC family protein [Desulfamplus sp.]|nr:TolC family protein [Desulfamplus sp.]
MNKYFNNIMQVKKVKTFVYLFMITIFGYAFILSNSTLQAQTLEELQKQAFEKRDIVKKYLTELENKKEKVKEQKGAFMPSLDIGYTVNILNHDTIMGESKENDTFQSAISWNAFAGFSDYYKLKAAEIMTRYSIEMVESTRQDICLNVALRFLEVYTALENLKVAEDEIKLYNDRLRQIELKFKVGVLKKSDVLKVKVERDNAIQTERKVRAAVDKSLNQLARESGILINKQSTNSLLNESLKSSELDFSLFQILPQKSDYHTLEPLLIKNRSDLNALKQTLEASEMGIKASKAALYPRADISLSYSSHTRDDFFIESMENSGDEVRCQTTISMNLFDGMQKYSKVRQAKFEKKGIQHDIIELESTLKTALQNTLIEAEVAFDNLAVAAAGTKEAEENLRVTDLGFEQGIGTSSDVLDAIYNLSRARFNEINAHTQVFANDFQIKRLTESF